MDAFCEQQPIQIGRLCDEIEQPVAGVNQIGTILEDVRHRRTENSPAGFLARGLPIPLQWLFPVSITKEATRRVGSPKAFSQALRPRLCVAVVTRSRHLDTSPPRVECVVCPFYASFFSHYRRLVLSYGWIVLAIDSAAKVRLTGARTFVQAAGFVRAFRQASPSLWLTHVQMSTWRSPLVVGVREFYPFPTIARNKREQCEN